MAQDDEQSRCLAAKRRHDAALQHGFTPLRPEPTAICLHCKNPFGEGKGYIGPDVALCDMCNSD